MTQLGKAGVKNQNVTTSLPFLPELVQGILAAMHSGRCRPHIICFQASSSRCGRD